ncbi:MAG: hypothetical protein KDJ86_16510 [Bauldia sp.]|uniref:hypothetical protein n=1 Tax=Bauldia sp. TaxID=2575872 RepID=UPI001E1334C3|nr:hypothetical protein [Bauldia sp.]MCB1497385.1 hypothetical protein [Bauldia sp.]
MIRRTQILLAGLLAVSAVASGAQTAAAETLALRGNQRWVQIASRQILDEAIAIARQYDDQDSRVVKAKNGWYAVVIGPYSSSELSAFRDDYEGEMPLPDDAYLARGTGYVATVWHGDPSAPASADTGVEHDYLSLYREAFNHYRNGEYDAALRAFVFGDIQASVHDAPALPRAKSAYYRAKIFLLRDNFDSAYKFFAIAKQLGGESNYAIAAQDLMDAIDEWRELQN